MCKILQQKITKLPFHVFWKTLIPHSIPNLNFKFFKKTELHGFQHAYSRFFVSRDAVLKISGFAKMKMILIFDFHKVFWCLQS